jgi:hypothetical protein
MFIKKVDDSANSNNNVLNSLKISVLVLALSFLIYHIYWAIQEIFFFIYITDIIFNPAAFDIVLLQFENLFLLAFQEYASITGYFLILIGGIFGLQSALRFMKNDKNYSKKLGLAFIFTSFFYILLLPSSLRHFFGVAVVSQNTNISNFYSIYVAFSTLIQALLIGVPLFVLGYKLKKTQNQASILKWTSIAAPLCVFGFWAYAFLLWVYALLPLGPAKASLMSTIGAVNSILTLLIAGIITTIVVLDYNRKKVLNKSLAGVAIVLVGIYYLVYVLVSIWVPIYFSFMQLTEIWLIVSPILGIVLLKLPPKVNNKN